MKKLISKIYFSILISFIGSFFLLSQNKDLNPYLYVSDKSEHKRFESEIQAFEELDKVKDYPKKSILFIGSSSIRLWKNLEESMSPYNIIQRGYGGAHYRDLVFYTNRILSDHSISLIVCFVANDIKGSAKDGSPKEIIELYDLFVRQVRSKHPYLPIVQIEITPTSSRWKHREKIKKVNKLINDYCDKKRNMHYIKTFDFFINESKTPNDELFLSDRLHLNQKGYSIWNKIVKEKIREVLSKDI
ncbi:MAG: GDSL-type esterase/lipase family protein [Flavobacteriaceae bacterium]|nr:GDSL-type esterase/lipase family protein [Flavobacteriaceae bacterium]